jgi:hypothetical protein
MQLHIIRPSKFWLEVAAIVGLICTALSIFFAIGATKILDDSIIRVKSPGTAIIKIEKAGKYTIYYEYESYSNGTIYDSNGVIDGLFTLTNKATKEQIYLDDSVGKSIYSTDNRTGHSVVDFEINEPGQYIIKTTYDVGTGKNDALAVRPHVGSQMIAKVNLFLAIHLGYLAIMVPVCIFAVTHLERSKSKSLNDFNITI